jgi:(p)ppGpp synthase/HD superfamily hydrolase
MTTTTMLKDVVIRSYIFAEKAHEGQTRRFSGLPYFTHPKAVARFVEELTSNPVLVAAALLHDTVEDTPVSQVEIDKHFGGEIGFLVDELTNKPDVREKLGLSKKEYILTKMSRMSENALLIKLCDRLHNILFLEEDCTSDEQREFIVRYTESTTYIMDRLFTERYAKGLTMNELHFMVIRRINSVLAFIYRAHFNGERPLL